MVVILDLRLGERGLLHRRPHHRLGAQIQRPVHHELHELLGDHRLGAEIHRQIRIVPVAGDAQPLELLALDVDPAFGEFAAFRAQLVDRHVVLGLALGPVLLLDLPFDRQTVTIPARHVAAVLAHHLLRADHHVLEDLVERVADMQMPVGIGRPVMQHEGRPPLLLAQLLIDPDRVPPRQPIRLAFGQARPHRKIGLRQEQRVFVFGRVGRHIGAHRAAFPSGTGEMSSRRERPRTGGSRKLERRAGNSEADADDPEHGAAYSRGARPHQSAFASPAPRTRRQHSCLIAVIASRSLADLSEHWTTIQATLDQSARS